jgi:hypothetical protein
VANLALLARMHHWSPLACMHVSIYVCIPPVERGLLTYTHAVPSKSVYKLFLCVIHDMCATHDTQINSIRTQQQLRFKAPNSLHVPDSIQCEFEWHGIPFALLQAQCKHSIGRILAGNITHFHVYIYMLEKLGNLLQTGCAMEPGPIDARKAGIEQSTWLNDPALKLYLISISRICMCVCMYVCMYMHRNTQVNSELSLFW